MDDFPIWLKGVVWVIIGSTALYAGAQILHSLIN